MSLSTLPNELLLIIAGYLPQECELNALARTNTRLYAIFDSLLYQRDASQFRSYALHRAIMDNSENTVLKALQHGAYIGPLKVGPDGRYESHQKQKRDKMSMIWYEYSPLCVAVKYKKLSIVRILLAHGAPVNVRDGCRRTPIVIAFIYQNTEILRFLLQYGADVNLSCHNGLTPLFLAAQMGLTEAVKILLERKDVDIDPLSNDERHDGRIESDAINPFRSPIRVRKRRLSPLIEAVKRQRVEIVRLLLAAGADPIGLHDSGDCPILVLAAKTGNATIVTMLLERGVEVDHRINFNYNALLAAAKEGHEGVVRALVNAGADPLIRDRDGKTLLNWAGLREEVSLICSLKAQADLLYTNRYGWPALSDAYRHSNRKVIAFLLEHMREETAAIRDFSWLTPLIS
ncbi:hypothetical protein AWENTII_002200 [Aspergillus wentii]